jgi:hypothetical protein
MTADIIVLQYLVVADHGYLVTYERGVTEFPDDEDPHLTHTTHDHHVSTRHPPPRRARVW